MAFLPRRPSEANLFEHRRAVCLWGGQGSGKTALCLEFCGPAEGDDGRMAWNLPGKHDETVKHVDSDSNMDVCGNAWMWGT